jgi:flagellar protein FliS
MPQAHPFATYQRTNVNTADQRTLIVMLYDGLLRFLRKAQQKIEAKDIEGAHNYLVRSREIVAELISTLRPEKGGEIGENLKRLYAFAFDKIVEANLYKDTAMVDEVIRVMTILREGWISMKSMQAPANPERVIERKRVSLTT